MGGNRVTSFNKEGMLWFHCNGFHGHISMMSLETGSTYRTVEKLELEIDLYTLP